MQCGQIDPNTPSGVAGAAGRYAWTFAIREGRAEEYVTRHREMAPAMREFLTRAGYRDYAIFLSGGRVFGSFVCDDMERMRRHQAEDRAALQWRREMSELVHNDPDPTTGALPLLTPVFWHAG